MNNFRGKEDVEFCKACGLPIWTDEVNEVGLCKGCVVKGAVPYEPKQIPVEDKVGKPSFVTQARDIVGHVAGWVNIWEHNQAIEKCANALEAAYKAGYEASTNDALKVIEKVRQGESLNPNGFEVAYLPGEKGDE